MADTVELPEITVTPGAPGGAPSTSGPPLVDTASVPATTAASDTTYMPPATRPANSIFAQEQATLIVQGINYQDWESVWVEYEWHSDSSKFRFTAVERDRPANMFYVLQFVPGESCQINLGGINVIDGVIEVRQVAYDANRHGVELMGRSKTAPVARSSVNTKTGSFDGMNYLQVAQKVISPFGVGVKVLGKLNPLPFKRLQNQPGEMVWDFLERIARPRGIILSCDTFGNFLLVGDHQLPLVGAQLIEGQNIKSCQFTLRNDWVYDTYNVGAQGNASDGNWGTAASQMEANWKGSGWLKSILKVPSEQPVTSIQEVQDRAKNEAWWNEGSKIEATITVQGWFKDASNLWWPGDNVTVISPMMPVNNVMKIKKVTFTQNSSQGTQTMILLVPPWGLRDDGQYNTENTDSTIPQAPSPTTITEPAGP